MPAGNNRELLHYDQPCYEQCPGLVGTKRFQIIPELMEQLLSYRCIQSVIRQNQEQPEDTYLRALLDRAVPSKNTILLHHVVHPAPGPFAKRLAVPEPLAIALWIPRY